jgi:hypothetical protein
LVRHGWFSVSTRRRLIVGAGSLKPSVFVVMTVKTQQFPVAPIGRVVVMVVVLVMDRELA